MRNETNNNKLKVLLVKPLTKPAVVEIENDLETLQRIVGGNIEALYPWGENVGIVCNEEGKLLGLDLNRALKTESGTVYDIIAGDFLIVALTEDDFGSLSSEQVKRYNSKFYYPEIFVQAGNEILAIPVM